MQATTSQAGEATPPHSPLTPDLAATYQHCQLLQRKTAELTARLSESRGQFFYAVAREFRLGNLSETDLAAIYGLARTLGPGFSAQWDAVAPVKGSTLLYVHRDRVKNAPNSADGKYWTGTYPFEVDAPVPARDIAVVYVLYDVANEPVYVGSSGHFRERVKRHAKYNGLPVAFWMACPADSREAAYLWEDAHLKERLPPMNKKASR